MKLYEIRRRSGHKVEIDGETPFKSREEADRKIDELVEEGSPYSYYSVEIDTEEGDTKE